MASQIAKNAALAAMKRAAARFNGNGNGNGCGSCAPPVAPCYDPRAPGVFDLQPKPVFRVDPNCPSPIGGSNWGFQSDVGFSESAGQVQGGLTQTMSASIPVPADASGLQTIESDPIPLNTLHEIVAKSRGKSIRLITLFFAATGAGAGAFSADAAYQMLRLLCRQGGSDFFDIGAFQAQWTNLGIPGYKCILNPVESSFASTTFRLNGQVPCDDEDDYNLIVTINATWGPYQQGQF